MTSTRSRLIFLVYSIPLALPVTKANAQTTAPPAVAQTSTQSATPSTPVSMSVVVEPSVLFPGQQYTLLLSLPEDICKGLKGGEDPLLALIEVKSSSTDAVAPSPLVRPVGSACKTTLPVAVGKDAPGGKVTLFLIGKADTGKPAPILGEVPVTIQLQKGPGAIPPGLDPGLDLMWKVLPRRAVADSFGNRVADGYFEIEAVLGNETGYDLQLSAIGFEVPQAYCLRIDREGSDAERIKDNDPSWDLCNSHVKQDDNTAGVKYGISTIHADPNATVIPVDAYPVVRGTVEREQSVGTRAFVVNLVKGASSVLVGVGGFYPDGGNFVRSSGIVSGPFEKALELVYPDLTTNHLINLDSRTLRDGVIVPNNTSFRINTFISRELVQCNYPKHVWQFGFTPQASYECVEDDGRLPWTRDFDPKQVMQRLGKLDLVGRKIQYLERVRVLTRTDNLPQSQGGPVLSTSAISVDRSTGQQFVMSGTNLHGAGVTSSSPCLKIKSQSVAADDASLQFTLDSGGCDTSQHPQLQVGSSHGFFVLNGNVIPPLPTVTTSTIDLSAASPYTISGTSLWEAKVTSTPDLGNIVVDASMDGTGLKITVDSTKVVVGTKYVMSVTTPGGTASNHPTAAKN